MSNLTRWEQVRDMMSLREAMDQLFDDVFTRPLSVSGASASPAIDLYQTEDDVFVKAAIPGLNPEEVDITVSDETLTLRGKYKQETEQKDTNYHIREHRSGSFQRTILLPSNVQANKVEAEFENGVLTIKIPTSEEVQPKSILIKAK